MDNLLKLRWAKGEHIFSGIKICDGVFQFSAELLHEVARQQGPQYVQINSQALLAEVQSRINRGHINLTLEVTSPMPSCFYPVQPPVQPPVLKRKRTAEEDEDETPRNSTREESTPSFLCPEH